MTYEEVKTAVQVLKAQGVYPSQRAILTHLGATSKRAVAAYLSQLTEEDPDALAMPPRPANGTVPGDTPTLQVTSPEAIQEPAPAPPDPPAAQAAGLRTLLAQAEADCQAALSVERRAKRDLDFAPRAERERLETAWQQARKAREAAAKLVAQRQRARASLLAAIGPARVAARTAAGAFAAAREDAQRQLVRLRREATMAQEDLDRMMQQLTALAGAQAVPQEPWP